MSHFSGRGSQRDIAGRKDFASGSQTWFPHGRQLLLPGSLSEHASPEAGSQQHPTAGTFPWHPPQVIS